MQVDAAVPAHPDSPRPPELRDPAGFAKALRASLPPGFAPATESVTVAVELDIDADGAVTVLWLMPWKIRLSVRP